MHYLTHVSSNSWLRSLVRITYRNHCHRPHALRNVQDFSRLIFVKGADPARAQPKRVGDQMNVLYSGSSVLYAVQGFASHPVTLRRKILIRTNNNHDRSFRYERLVKSGFCESSLDFLLTDYYEFPGLDVSCRRRPTGCFNEFSNDFLVDILTLESSYAPSSFNGF